MPRTHLVIEADRGGWVHNVPELAPGAHVAVFAFRDADAVAVQGRTAGLEFRDTLLVLWPGPRLSFALLFRKPLAENTVVEQVMATGTGALNVDGCRIATAEINESERYAHKPPPTRAMNVASLRMRGNGGEAFTQNG